MKKIIILLLLLIVTVFAYYFRSTGMSEYCQANREYGFVGSSCWKVSFMLDRSLYDSKTELEIKLKLPLHTANRLSVFTKEKSKSYWLKYHFRYGDEVFSSGLIVSLGGHGGMSGIVQHHVDKGKYILSSETSQYKIYRDANDPKKSYYLGKLDDFYMRCVVNCWFMGVFNDRVLVKYGFPKKWLENNYDPIVIPSLVIKKILVEKI